MARWAWILVGLIVGMGGTVGAQEETGTGASLYTAHCASCHGPEGRGNGADADLFDPPPRDLRTGVLSRYTDDELVERIRHGRALGLIRDPNRMRARIGDTEMLVKYLERLPTLPWREIEAGQELYVDRCEVCHGAFGHPSTILPLGVSTPPRDLSDPTYQRETSDRVMLERARRGHERMPAILGLDSKDDQKALLAFLRLLSPGYEHYSRFCAGCHGDDGRGPGVDWATTKRPTVIFDQAYFKKKDPEALRVDVWHMASAESPQMPHMARALRPREVRLVLDWLRALPVR